MAAGDFTALKGPLKIIRPTVSANKEKGDYEIINHTIGFWLHDVAANTQGSFCISAGLVRMKRSILTTASERTAAITAGSVIFVPRNQPAQRRVASGTAQSDSGSPGVFGVVYEDSSANSTDLLIVFEHH